MRQKARNEGIVLLDLAFATGTRSVIYQQATHRTNQSALVYKETAPSNAPGVQYEVLRYGW
ncbi:hypothetical protein D3C80_2166310 [compost metagenome]